MLDDFNADFFSTFVASSLKFLMKNKDGRAGEKQLILVILLMNFCVYLKLQKIKHGSHKLNSKWNNYENAH